MPHVWAKGRVMAYVKERYPDLNAVYPALGVFYTNFAEVFPRTCAAVMATWHAWRRNSCPMKKPTRRRALTHRHLPGWAARFAVHKVTRRVET